jgi:hypothetical protein
MSLVSYPASVSATDPGYLDFGTIPAAPGAQFVEVNLPGSLIAMAGRLVEKTEPDAAVLIKGLKGIRVNVVGIDESNRQAIEQKISSVRQELSSKGWVRVVTAQEKGQDVGVYVKTRGEESFEGVVVTVLQDKGEAVFINVVGDINPEKLATLGEKFNLDPLKQVGHKIPAMEPEKK